jgi:hypothetical protein
MAGNKPFANLDRLAKLVRPEIIPFDPKISQGGPTKPAPLAEEGDISIPQFSAPNTKFRTEISLADRLDQTKLGTTNHLAQYLLSDKHTNKDANTKFRKTISLANRLDQANLGTTNHLAQFFLSDVFTGVIRIKTPRDSKVGFANTVVIGKPTSAKSPKQQGGENPRYVLNNLINQGGEDPVYAIDSVEARQGIILVKGSKSSSIVVSKPTSIETKQQQTGIKISGGQLSSATKVEKPVEKIEQGGITITAKKAKSLIQGGENPTLAKTEEQVQASQGITAGQFALTSFIVPDKPAESVNQGIVKLGGQDQSLIVPTFPPERLNQGYLGLFGVSLNNSITVIESPGTVFQGPGTDPSAPTGEITDGQVPSRQGSSTLRTLSYTLGGITLRTAPELYQGGNLPTNELPGEGGHEIVDTRSAKVSILLNPPKGTAAYTKAQLSAGIPITSTGGSLEKYDNVAKAEDGSYKNVEQQSPRSRKVVKVLNTPVNYDDSAIVDQIDAILKEPNNGQQSSTTKYSSYFKGDNKSSNSTIKELVDGDGQLNKNVAIAEALSTKGDSNEVERAVVDLVKSKITSDRIKEYKRGFDGSTSYKYYDDVTSYDQIIQAAGTATGRQGDVERPSSIIKIADYSNEDTNVVFDAFIKTFSDGLTVNYQDFKHIGQQDVFKVFTGTTRQISLAFSAVAMPESRDFKNSNINAAAMLEKINKLMLICGVGSIEGEYIKGPIVKVTVAGLVSDLICACGSVKVESPVTESPWDVDVELPQMFEVTLDLAVLAMQGGSLLNRSGKFYKV